MLQLLLRIVEGAARRDDRLHGVGHRAIDPRGPLLREVGRNHGQSVALLRHL
jgi:hypothetical protein